MLVEIGHILWQIINGKQICQSRKSFHDLFTGDGHILYISIIESAATLENNRCRIKESLHTDCPCCRIVEVQTSHLQIRQHCFHILQCIGYFQSQLIQNVFSIEEHLEIHSFRYCIYTVINNIRHQQTFRISSCYFCKIIELGQIL